MAGKTAEIISAFGEKLEYHPGLEGVIAAPSTVCFIDGIKGVLLYRGIPIEELAEHSSFEETSYFSALWEAPNAQRA